ncbi:MULTISPECIES: hypothetical protein [Actinoalloteichus]|uniref:Uncharacterized protein n=1 Tax=Actinoalloteichus fjordicus TaxID=1612552 RepID=A0AAC9LJG4_9PSEU|nr:MULTISPECIES: hypothetical protein [Actinoalloteichus]APU17940.1 hypothetical protein UA74_29740 [Actinoalloteichus fjordicus]APU24019.1 hypothetical protein UA75_30275 [Actinoalloteichus sp. GBA129-24]
MRDAAEGTGKPPLRFFALTVLSMLALSVPGLSLPGLAGPVAHAESAQAESVEATGEAGQTLILSRADGLDPAGEQVTVVGRGFDENKGIYVALCVLPEPGGQPGPCLGGVDMEGESGASSWISSTPPPYGEGLATPYADDGSFTVELSVQAQDQFTDCLDTPCGVVTRADHLRTGDRSQDVLIPVSFAESSGGDPADASADAAAAGEGDDPVTDAAQPAAEPEGPSTGLVVGGVAAAVVVLLAVVLVMIRRRAATNPTATNPAAANKTATGTTPTDGGPAGDASR